MPYSTSTVNRNGSKKMKSEFSANQVQALQIRKNQIEALIRTFVGIVPQAWYDELDRIEIKLLKVEKHD